MKLVVLGLSLSSSWGNGHATTYRALLKAFAERGHEILFLERDVPWYAAHRDLEPDFCQLAFYSDLADLDRWRLQVATADAVIVGSYVPDGIAVGEWVLAHQRGVSAFYDIDTPVTLANLETGRVDYISKSLIPRYDLYLSFTGGPTLRRIERELGAPAARALYCSVDTDLYRPTDTAQRWDLSYLGTYSADRQPILDRLLLQPARAAPHLRFCVAGPQYPADLAWPENVERIDHVGPADHPTFYGASRFTLNVTRADMAAAGFSPSVRLFEAAACAAPVISDTWDGIETLLAPDQEIILAEDGQTVLATLAAPDLAPRIGQAARRRILNGHTARHRALELDALLRQAASPPSPSIAEVEHA